MLVIPTAFILFVSIAHTTTYAVYLFDTILLNIVLPSVVIICVMLVPVLRHPVHALLALLGAFVQWPVSSFLSVRSTLRWYLWLFLLGRLQFFFYLLLC